MFYEFMKLLALREEIKKVCPNVKSIAETYLDDKGQINIICREFECNENDLLLTPDEFNYLTSYEYR